MRAIVIATRPGQRRFACETDDGLCTVFVQWSDPLMETGDIVSGEVLSLGSQTLDCEGTECCVTGEVAGLNRADAMARLRCGPPHVPL